MTLTEHHDDMPVHSPPAHDDWDHGPEMFRSVFWVGVVTVILGALVVVVWLLW